MNSSINEAPHDHLLVFFRFESSFAWTRHFVVSAASVTSPAPWLDFWAQFNIVQSLPIEPAPL
jgi:hypothetical protein